MCMSVPEPPPPPAPPPPPTARAETVEKKKKPKTTDMARGISSLTIPRTPTVNVGGTGTGVNMYG